MKLAELAERAEEALKIDVVLRGRSAYHYAEEVGEWYRLTRTDLAYAEACAGEPDAYSLWCAGTGRPVSRRQVRRLGLGDAS